MTSLELFSAFLILVGLAAAGAYTYALNRGSSRLKDTDADGLSGGSAQEALHRQQESERELGEAVGRADLAASSAEAAAVRAEAALQALEALRVRRTTTNIQFSTAAMAYTPGARLNLMHPFPGIGWGISPDGGFIVGAACDRVTERETEAQSPERSSASSYEYSSTRQ